MVVILCVASACREKDGGHNSELLRLLCGDLPKIQTVAGVNSEFRAFTYLEYQIESMAQSLVPARSLGSSARISAPKKHHVQKG